MLEIYYSKGADGKTA
jgi:serine/threonine protein kinase